MHHYSPTQGCSYSYRTWKNILNGFYSLVIQLKLKILEFLVKRVWDRDHAGYIELFNSKIRAHKSMYKGPNKRDDDWLEQMSFPLPNTTWSWGTWGEWGDWSVGLFM